MGTPIWKEVLCLGRQCTRDGDWFEFKPKHIREAHRNFQKMKRRGVPVPGCWEHQDLEAGDAPPDADAVAEWKRAYARYTFAHLEDSRINDRGNLEMLHDVADPADIPRLKAVRFVSPKVYRGGYLDSRGGVYEGCTVVHSAATPTPVQHWQAPFSVNLSDSDSLYFSYTAPESEVENPQSCPAFNWSFDAWLAEIDRANAGVELSTTEATPEGQPVADDKEKKAPSEDADKGKNADLAAVIKAIRDAFGATISDKVSNWNELVIALESQKGSAEAEVEPEPEAPAEPATSDAGGPPMLMSTLDKDPAKRKQAEAWARDERKDATDRINAAISAGKLSPFEGRKLLRQAGAVELSFTDGEPTGAKWTKLLADIAAAEKGPVKFKVKADDSATNLSTTEVEPPAKVVGGHTAGTEEAKNLILSRIAGKDPQK